MAFDPMTAAVFARAAPGVVLPHDVAPPQGPVGNPEGQLFAAFLQGVSGDLLLKVYRYLEENLERHPQLGDSIAGAMQAVQLYRGRDFLNAFMSVFFVYRYISMLRMAKPDVPELPLVGSQT